MDIMDIAIAKQLVGGGGTSLTIEPLVATQNGTFEETGKAFSPVTVNVDGWELLKETEYEVESYTSSSITTIENIYLPKAYYGNRVFYAVSEYLGTETPHYNGTYSLWMTRKNNDSVSITLNPIYLTTYGSNAPSMNADGIYVSSLNTSSNNVTVSKTSKGVGDIGGRYSFKIYFIRFKV